MGFVSDCLYQDLLRMELFDRVTLTRLVRPSVALEALRNGTACEPNDRNCDDCGIAGTLENTRVILDHKRGNTYYSPRCKACTVVHTRKQKRIPSKFWTRNLANAVQKIYIGARRKGDKGITLASVRKDFLRLTVGQLQDMLEHQGGLCACCKRVIGASIDATLPASINRKHSDNPVIEPQNVHLTCTTCSAARNRFSLEDMEEFRRLLKIHSPLEMLEVDSEEYRSQMKLVEEFDDRKRVVPSGCYTSRVFSDINGRASDKQKTRTHISRVLRVRNALLSGDEDEQKMRVNDTPEGLSTGVLPGKRLGVEFYKSLAARQSLRDPYTGIPLRPLDEPCLFQISVDRIDGRRGYAEDNVHLVLRVINFAKGACGDDENRLREWLDAMRAVE